MNLFDKKHKRQLNGSREQAAGSGKKSNLAFPPAPRSPLPATRRNGFTLVELIVVISIIILLTGILLPTITKARYLGYRAATRAYITTLENGALRYQQENQYFPGQENTSIMGNANNLYTGSQILISDLAGIPLAGSGTYANPEDIHPTSEYVEYKEEQVTTVTDANGDSRRYTPIDSYPGDDAQAILYYPSQLGNDGSIGNSYVPPSFVYNQAYTDNDDSTTNNFKGLIWDTRFGRGDSVSNTKTTWGSDVPNLTNTNASNNKAFNSDTFLIFGKGLEDRDQAYSWFIPSSPKNFTSEGYTP